MSEDNAQAPATRAGTKDKVPERTIEEHAETLNVPLWQLAGVKTREDWPMGKTMPEAEFAAALKKWLDGPTVLSEVTGG